MAKQIARLLKTDVMADLDLPGLAQLLASQGRKGDTMLAHITPKEAALLRAEGGAGTTNPNTGLPEFYDGFKISDYADFSTPNIKTGGYAPKAQPELSYGFNAPATYEYSDPTAQMAERQYAGSAFPYDLAQKQGYQEIPANLGISNWSQFQPEFPAGMQSGVPRISGSGAPVISSVNAPTPPELSTPAVSSTPAAREQSLLDRLKTTATSPETLRALGVAGIQALPGIIAARQASAQGRQARAEMQRMAAPYQQQGQQLIAQAQRGELTAPAQQQIQALQAQAAQGAAGRGGVGAEQAAAQVEAFRQQLLQNQYDMGLKVANIGDQIAAGAIRTGLQADQYVNELTNNYFSTLARSMGGQPQTMTQTQQPR